ncbi:hypothetical protein LTR85_008918 [Meristemomyces frigidus]|nr:hypothetical protein LTR85_008918 [Meristemomyces frigidus]
MQAPPVHWGRNFTPTVHHDPTPAIDPSKVTLPPGFTIVVTGAGKGIGEYIAKAYAKARASAVIITSRTAKDLERVKGELEQIASSNGVEINVSTLAGDASREEHYQQIKQLLATEHDSRLDVLVNNAGTIGSNQGFTNKLPETSSEDMEWITALNYLGPVGKTIINVSSVGAFMTSNNPIAYGISKVALNRLTEHVAENYVDEGLVCLALHPGGVMSDSGSRVPEFLQAMLKDDITLCGAVCVWLSKEQQPWASGRFLAATWDMQELEATKD